MSVVATKFDDSAERAYHYERHGAEFGASSDIEYEAMANRFLNDPPVPTMQECTRRGNGDMIRFDTATDFLGVVRADGTH